MFRRLATIVASLGLLLQSSSPVQAIETANDKIPQTIWEVVADPDHQERVFLNGAGNGGEKWQGGYLISSRDGLPVTFRYQIGSGHHRIEYDNRQPGTVFVLWGACTEGPTERLSGDPRPKDAELRFIECDEPNQFVIETNQAWWFPPGTKRMV